MLRLLICAAAVVTASVVLAPAAQAHPLSTTAILLDVGPTAVTGTIELPLDRLAIALDEPTLTPAVAVGPATLARLRTYVAAHLSAADPDRQTSWTTEVTSPRIGPVDGVEHLLVDVRLTPPSPASSAVDLRYDGIVHHLQSHRILVSARPAGSAGDYTAVGVLDWQSHALRVPIEGAAVGAAFLDAVGLGVAHIAEGADHLLFLLMLLLPAPLLVRGRRWVRGGDLRGQVRRTVQVVSAFAVGHSVTLALGALGLVDVPTRLVESLIAVSILVSGVHALRPVVRGGEVGIAAGFGLMHGLAFAGVLGELGLGRSSLLAELLGFNLGIEVTQLLVVALVMPSLLVLARSRVYPVVRAVLATSGIVLAAAWLAERIGVISTDPFEPVSTRVVEHWWALPATLALCAALTLVSGNRSGGDPEGDPSASDARFLPDRATGHVGAPRPATTAEGG